MSWRSIAVYYAAAAVLGGYLWVTHRASQAVEVAGTGEHVVAPIVEELASRLDRVDIDAGGVQVLLLRGEDRRWSVTRPPGIKISSDLVVALLDTLTTIPAIEVLPAENGDLAGFGLSPAEISVAISGAGKLIAELGIGKRNPTRTAVYAVRRGAAGVYLLGLNARYYLELILDELVRQSGGGGG